jgi:hypothetical protein
MSFQNFPRLNASTLTFNSGINISSILEVPSVKVSTLLITDSSVPGSTYTLSISSSLLKFNESPLVPNIKSGTSLTPAESVENNLYSSTIVFTSPYSVAPIVLISLTDTALTSNIMTSSITSSIFVAVSGAPVNFNWISIGT